MQNWFIEVLSTKNIIIASINIALFLILVKIIFKSGKKFLLSIYYIFYPNILSILKKDFDRDATHTYKLLLLLAILFIVVAIEIKIFYG